MGRINYTSSLHEPRFENPGSGLLRFIQQAKNWFGGPPSAIGLDVIAPPELSAGIFGICVDKHGRMPCHYDVIGKM